MSPSSLCPRYILSLLLAVFLASFAAPVRAVGAPELPSLDRFIETVRDGDADSLLGIYVPGVMASRVIVQPNGDWTFVSSLENTVTDFLLAERFGSRGLLAHNTLAGRYFAELEVGEEFILVYGDGRTETFMVAEVIRFRALNPERTRGLFVDLNNGTLMGTDRLFWRVYDRPGNVILQTCIAVRGELSWGRLFVIAEPVAG